MNSIGPKSPHNFHIPVMGTGFSIDTPLKVARYGISSVVSLVDDVLMEQMRKYHCGQYNRSFVEIPESDNDFRANRIKAYLELLDELIREQVKELQSSPFETDSSITRYFELLPDSPLKDAYNTMLAATDPEEKVRLQNDLRLQAVPGTIDVNIMTKLDRDIYHNGEKLPAETADAMSALRGYAKSRLRSSIIFSAGFNRRLFGYMEQFDDFYPDENNLLKKKIVLKVSDFRSALVQGKYLAKRGLWVSEYRIESGLNCGGHAFATEGFLMGPIMEEFSSKKMEFIEQLYELYNNGLTGLKRGKVQTAPDVRLTVQGGIGTADENTFLLDYYSFDGTGWGTPFLLVPEVTNVDEDHLAKLLQAGDREVHLSDRSPLGVPFWSLKTSASELIRQKRIDINKPGSPCPKGFLVSNTEFTKVPICHASRVFQKRKLKQLDESDVSGHQLDYRKNYVIAKACICHDLAGCATLKYGIDKEATPAVCCGPNIVNFSKIATLEEMVGHIYGRLSLMTNAERPHMFIRELAIYVDFLREDLRKASEGLLEKTTKSFLEFKQNLLEGIEYYQDLAEQFSAEQKKRFLDDLDALFKEIEKVLPESTVSVSTGLAS